MPEVNHCGNCTRCCFVFEIRDMPGGTKPLGEWCKFCSIGEGCNIYDERPKSCIEFRCLWLQLQDRPDLRPSNDARPDNCGVMFSRSDSTTFIAHLEKPDTPWRYGPAKELVDFLVHQGFKVVISAGDLHRKRLVYRHYLTKEVVEEDVELSEPDADGIQRRIDL